MSWIGEPKSEKAAGLSMDSLPSSACLLPLLIHTEANRTVLVGCTPGKSEYQCLKSNGIRDACSTADIIDCHSLPVLKTNTQTFEDCEMSKLTSFAPSVWGFSFPLSPTKISTASGGFLSKLQMQHIFITTMVGKKTVADNTNTHIRIQSMEKRGDFNLKVRIWISWPCLILYQHIFLLPRPY